MLKKAVFIFLSFGLFLNADGLKIAVAAGYKKPMLTIIKEYQKTGKEVEAFFGNMKQISIQAKQTDAALIIGDKNFLYQKSQLDIKEHYTLGLGKVVVAYSKKVKLSSIDDLTRKDISKIAMPQPPKAIYGLAGEEFLKKSNLYEKIKDKLLVVSTVPQVVTYLVANEVDVGIINLTAALANKDKIGGFIEVDQEDYSQIEIIAAKLKDCKTAQCEAFFTFLQSSFSKEVFVKYGL